MPILDIQRQLVEIGRIRTGDQVEIAGEKGKRRPRRLETFRLTSQCEEVIRQAAELYGGKPEPWEDGQWQVTITAKTLPIMLPPFESLSQWYEMWSGGGCQRRCDGEREVLTDKPCMCPADKTERADLAKDGKACKPTTRLNVILPELQGLGVWRLESHGYYAAVELAGSAEYLSMATTAGHRIPAHLRIVTRRVKRQVNGKPQTRVFTVPTIDIAVRPMDLLAGAELAALPSGQTDRLLPSGPVNRRQRVERPGQPAAEPLPDGAGFERPSNPPLGPAPDLPGEGFSPIEEEPAVVVVEARPTLAQRLQDLADELAGDVGTGPVTDEQRLAVQKIVAPLGLECFGNAVARVWGLERDPRTRKWPLLAPQAAAIVAASAEGDFQARWSDLGTSEVRDGR